MTRTQRQFIREQLKNVFRMSGAPEPGKHMLFICSQALLPCTAACCLFPLQSRVATHLKLAHASVGVCTVSGCCKQMYASTG